MSDGSSGPAGPSGSPADGSDNGGRRDIDAEFAALMGGLGDLDLPDPDGLDAPTGEPGQRSERNETDGVVHELTRDDVPHNTYAPGSAVAGAAGASGPAGDAALPKAVKVAVVLTPLASSEALAQLCAMSDLDCTVVPADSGAFAVKEFVSAHSEWDVDELLGGADSEPAEAAELASALSRLSRAGVVLMTADLATDVGIESGLSGTITARRYVGGQAGEEASSGLLLASMDQVVEDVLLGILRADDAPGAIRTSEVRPGRAARFLGRSLRRRKNDPGAAPDSGDPS